MVKTAGRKVQAVCNYMQHSVMHKFLETYLQTEMDIVFCFQSDQGIIFWRCWSGTLVQLNMYTFHQQENAVNFGDLTSEAR